MPFFWGSSLIAKAYPSDFITINISKGLSHNMVNAIYKDHRGFIWLGTQLGLDRFDGIRVTNYSALKNQSVLAIAETDPVFLWVGTDKGLVKVNRKTEVVETIRMDEKQPMVRALHPVSENMLLVGTQHGLYIVHNNKIEKINLGVDVLAKANTIYRFIEGKEERTYWIGTHEGLVYFDLNTKKAEVYLFSADTPELNNYYSLIRIENTLYLGTKNVGIVTFDTVKKSFARFPYHGNPYITTLTQLNDEELCVGTNGSGLKIVSIATGDVLSSIEHTSDGKGISSNAIYSFLKDDNVFWIGTYMGGLNYNPVLGDKFSVYAFDSFNSLHHNVRSLWIGDDGQKLIGTRDGLIYISEKKQILKHYTTRNSALRADIIVTIYPLTDQRFLIGTFSGGVSQFDTSTLEISDFHAHDDFQRGSFPAFIKAPDGKLWMPSSRGAIVYDLVKNNYIRYTNINSGLKSNVIYSSIMDSNNHILFGTGDGICMYDLNTKMFRTDMLPAHILPHVKSVRYIFEDSHKNLWFCDDKEGMVKVDQLFTRFEHITTAEFLPSNSVMSITEDKHGGLWFSTQYGLLNYNDNGGPVRFFSLYDGIPGYIFSNSVQRTSDGTIWWGNEQGLVYYKDKGDREENSENISYHSHTLPAITAISVAGKTLRAGSEELPYDPVYTKKLSLKHGQSIEFTFSALNYARENTDIYEYQLEGYDEGWQVLMSGSKVSYPNLPSGKYIFSIRSSSTPEYVTSLAVRVIWDIPKLIWLTLVSILSIIFLLFCYSRLLTKYRQLNRDLNRKREELPQKEKYAKTRMEETTVDAVRVRLLRYMKEEKPYLNPELKLQDVAGAIACSSVELSQLLNVHLQTNFADFVNQYRIDEFIVRVQDKSAMIYTLSSLSEQSGFNSRTSFFRSFKKIKGTTPAEYIKDMGIELKK